MQVKEVDIRTQKASRQWYLKFHEVRMTFGFKENCVDQCIYLKVSGSKFLFLVRSFNLFFAFWWNIPIRFCCPDERELR